MKKYTVIKRDVNGQFEYELAFDTWRALANELNYRARYQNSIFYSGDAVIYENDVEIGKLSGLWHPDKRIKNITKHEFIENQ